MTTSEFVNSLLDVLGEGPHYDTMRLELRLIFRQLHDALPSLELNDGSPVSDMPNLRELCREAINYLSPVRPIFSAKPFCPRCSHRHEGLEECGVDMGGGGKCDCRVEVTA